MARQNTEYSMPSYIYLFIGYLPLSSNTPGLNIPHVFLSSKTSKKEREAKETLLKEKQQMLEENERERKLDEEQHNWEKSNNDPNQENTKIDIENWVKENDDIQQAINVLVEWFLN